MQRRSTTNGRFPAAIAVTAVICTLAAAGCKGGSSDAAKKPPPSPSASTDAAAVPPLEAQIGDLKMTLLDEKGRTMMAVSARAGSVGPGTGGGIGGAVGGLKNGTVVLYQSGKPAARLTADTLTASQSRRSVVGTGKVVVRSLALPDSPAIRSDTMTWRYDTGTIQGTGNVLVTREPGTRIPGRAFTADTKLSRFTLEGGAGPAFIRY